MTVTNYKYKIINLENKVRSLEGDLKKLEEKLKEVINDKQCNCNRQNNQRS